MNAEQPQYTLKQSMKRILIPKTFQLIGLGAVFYFAIWLNLYLLAAKDSTKMYVTFGAFVVLIIAVIVQIILIVLKVNKNKYSFYPNKLEFKGQTIPYVNITNVSFSRNFLDKIFDTGTIILYPDFKIENVPNLNQVFIYVQKLVQIAKQRIVY